MFSPAASVNCGFSTSPQGRALSPFETVLEGLNSSTGTWSIVTTSQVRGPLSEADLKTALDRVQQRHAYLNVRIVGSLTALQFAPMQLSAIPLRVVSDQSWQAVVNAELNQPLDSSQSLMRVVLVRDRQLPDRSYLVTTTHHAISDGTTCMKLHAELLSASQGQPLDYLMPSSSLPPALEQLLPPSFKGFSGRLRATLFLLRLTVEKLVNPIGALQPDQQVAIVDRRCCSVHRLLPTELYPRLLQRCAAEQTTVHGAICAAMAMATWTELRQNLKSGQGIRMSCQTAVDLRRTGRLDRQANQVLASLISSVQQRHYIQPKTRFWDLARQIKRQISGAIAQDYPLQMVLLGKVLFDYAIAHPNAVDTTLFVSNLGKVDLPRQYGQLELEAISFTAANALFAGVFNLYVSSFANQMQLNFVFSTPSFSPERMERLVEATIAQLWQAC